MEADFWNERFGGEEYVYGEAPNAYLKQKLTAGNGRTALFPGEGEGRNAVFAASLGWQVTAFDQSIEGQKKAYALAEKVGCKINYVIARAEDYETDEQFDLIGLFYLHMPNESRQEIHRKLWNYLKPGGQLIIEAFTPAQLAFQSGGPKHIDMLYTTNAIKQDFEDAAFVECYEQQKQLDEGPFHQGMASVLNVFAIKKQ